jgi:hypothetical protein
MPFQAPRNTIIDLGAQPGEFSFHRTLPPIRVLCPDGRIQLPEYLESRIASSETFREPLTTLLRLSGKGPVRRAFKGVLKLGRG